MVENTSRATMKVGNMEKFIELVSRYPVLYDPSHPYNKDKEMKNQIWERLAATMDCPMKAVQNRWRGLKDTYSRHLKAVSGHRKYGKTHCKNWLWAKHMSFMEPFMGFRDPSSTTIRRRRGTRSRPLRTPMLTNADTTSEDQRLPVDSDSAAGLKNDGPATQQTVTQDVTHDAVDETLSSSAQYNEVSALDKFVGFLENGKEMDAVDYLFLSWAKTVKQFSPRRLLTVKKKISDLVMQMEQDQLEEDDTLHYTSTIGESAVTNRHCGSSCASSWSSRGPSPAPDPLVPQSDRPPNAPIIKSETNGYYQNGIR